MDAPANNMTGIFSGYSPNRLPRPRAKPGILRFCAIGTTTFLVGLMGMIFSASGFSDLLVVASMMLVALISTLIFEWPRKAVLFQRGVVIGNENFTVEIVENGFDRSAARLPAVSARPELSQKVVAEILRKLSETIPG